jgi:hypothetical protein
MFAATQNDVLLLLLLIFRFKFIAVTQILKEDCNCGLQLRSCWVSALPGKGGKDWLIDDVHNVVCILCLGRVDGQCK